MIVGFFLPLFNPGLPDFDEAIAAFDLLDLQQTVRTRGAGRTDDRVLGRTAASHEGNEQGEREHQTHGGRF